MQMNNNTKLIVGVLAGVAAGFALGMMLAPKKGSELRSDMLGSLEDLQDKVTDLLEEGRQKLSDLTGMGADDFMESASVNQATTSKKAVS
jgi:gas vesicle protein